MSDEKDQTAEWVKILVQWALILISLAVALGLLRKLEGKEAIMGGVVFWLGLSMLLAYVPAALWQRRLWKTERANEQEKKRLEGEVQQRDSLLRAATDRIQSQEQMIGAYGQEKIDREVKEREPK